MVTQTVSTPSLDRVGTPTGGPTNAAEPKPIHDTLRFLGLAFQLGLVVLVVLQFQLESSGFRQLTILAAGGFVVHYFLPLRLRLHFFLALSFVSIALLFGPVQGALLSGLGLALIGICHLPLQFRLRVGLLITVGVLMACCRIGWIDVPWATAVWPILASIFMFRLIVYMYDVRHEETPAPIAQRLAYFFMLPNLCFPLFPVVDYQTFRKGYYKGDRHENHQIGLEWILRGVTHLLLYRFVYYHLVIDATEVADAGSLARFLIATFLLYLRVSGQFHVIIGMMRLFGFNLPETNHQYFLSSGFTDFWRRINIYWKDFMMKVFYYPAYFQLRRRGHRPALVLSTLIVFLVTWTLHSYQWFWMSGSFLLAWNDALFWAILAVLLVANVLWEDTRASRRAPDTGAWTIARNGSLILRTGATFVVVAVLWSLWMSASIPAWLAMMSKAAALRSTDSRIVPALLIGGLGFAAATLYFASRDRRLRMAQPRPRFAKSALATTTALVLLYVVGQPSIYGRFDARSATIVQNLRSTELNRLDAGLQQRGYYENLVAVNRFNSRLWESYLNRPVDWLDQQVVTIARPTGDFLQRELVPSSEFFASGAKVTTNQWGMRDREYALHPAPGAYRIAVLGASPVMGQGVGDHETFESLVEDRLNSAAESARPYEILNFAVSGYKPLQQLMVLQKKVVLFEPDAVFYVATGGEHTRAALYLVEAIRNGTPVPYAHLKELASRSGVETTTDETVAQQRLRPHSWDLLRWMYREFAAESLRQGAIPVWIYLPGLSEEAAPDYQNARQLAAEEGFAVLDLFGSYGGYDRKLLGLAQWDDHPNVIGHRLIAERLHALLLERPELLGLHAR